MMHFWKARTLGKHTYLKKCIGYWSKEYEIDKNSSDTSIGEYAEHEVPVYHTGFL